MLFNITIQMLGDSYGFDCPIALYNDHIMTLVMCYINILLTMVLRGTIE
jgi:hypothetical protein